MTLQFINRYLQFNLDFEKYLEIDRLSNSTIKGMGKEFKMTEKIQFGKEVDEILTNPTYVSQNNGAKIVASTIMENFGHVIDMCQAQVSAFATARIEIGGGVVMDLDLKTRPDFVLMGSDNEPRVSIDLKVSAEKVVNFRNVLEFMGWDIQCYLHRMLTGAQKSYLLIYSRPDQKALLVKQSDCFDTWMGDIVFDFGKRVN